MDIFGLDVNKVLGNPAFQLGAGIGASNTGHYGQFGPAFGGGLQRYNQFQQQQMQQDALRRKLMQEQQAQKWIKQNMGQFSGAPQFVQQEAVKSQFRPPEKPSAFQEKMNLYKTDPATYKGMGFGQSNKPTATATIINEPADPASEKMYEGMAKNVSDRIGDYRGEAKRATDLQSSLNRFSMAMERAGKTGRWEDTKKTLLEYSSAFGFNVDEGTLSDQQKVDMAAKAMIADQLRQNVGPQTNFDAIFTGEYMPNLRTTTEANREAIRYMSSANKLRQIYGTMATSAWQGGNFKSVQEALTAVDRYAVDIPAVIKTEAGWLMFGDFYKEGRRGGKKDAEILESWAAVAGEYR